MGDIVNIIRILSLSFLVLSAVCCGKGPLSLEPGTYHIHDFVCSEMVDDCRTKVHGVSEPTDRLVDIEFGPKDCGFLSLPRGDKPDGLVIKNGRCSFIIACVAEGCAGGNGAPFPSKK